MGFRRGILLTLMLGVFISGALLSVGVQHITSLRSSVVPQLRKGAPADARTGILRYAGTEKIQYQGDYYIADSSKQIYHPESLPAELKHNAFVRPIEVDPLIIDTPDGPARPHGQGSLFNTSGQLIYEGGWLNGFENGFGISYFEDGQVWYRGDYVEGRWQGNGELYTELSDHYYRVYAGQFYYQTFHGKGALYDGNGQKQFEGNWYFGEPQ